MRHHDVIKDSDVNLRFGNLASSRFTCGTNRYSVEFSSDRFGKSGWLEVDSDLCNSIKDGFSSPSGGKI